MNDFLDFMKNASEYEGNLKTLIKYLRYREESLQTDADDVLRPARFWTPGRRVGRRGKSLGPVLLLNHL